MWTTNRRQSRTAFQSIVLDVGYKRLFFAVRTGTDSTAKPLRRFIKVFFHNKGIDKVKLTAILHNKFVRSKVPIYFQEQASALVSYKYTNNISRTVFNYNPTLRNINLDDYRNASSSCDCESSTFRYEPHGHVITGDLRIVRFDVYYRKDQSTGSRILSIGNLTRRYW